jgi:hypothetical protein
MYDLYIYRYIYIYIYIYGIRSLRVKHRRLKFNKIIVTAAMKQKFNPLGTNITALYFIKIQILPHRKEKRFSIRKTKL